MSTLNERSYELANAMVADADKLGIAVSSLNCGTRIIDCGVKAPGSLEAGRRLAEVCMAGLATVEINPSRFSEWHGAAVELSTIEPIAACMASQYAGWQITGEKYFAMGSGPMRAAACREELFKDIGHCETPEVCVGVLETSKLPPDAVCVEISTKCKISAEHLTLCVARTSSPAGTVQIVARSLETALHKLHVLRFDLCRCETGSGWAPLPPVGNDDLAAIGYTNDAILYGGRVLINVLDGSGVDEIGPRVPSCSSPDFGRPFAEIFKRYDSDFYRIDPMLFSPAEIHFYNLETNRVHKFGTIAPEILAESFAKK